MGFRYLRNQLKVARKYLCSAGHQERRDGYLIGLLINVRSLKDSFPKNREVNNFAEGVESLVDEFSSRERLESVGY